MILSLILLSCYNVSLLVASQPLEGSHYPLFKRTSAGNVLDQRILLSGFSKLQRRADRPPSRDSSPQLRSPGRLRTQEASRSDNTRVEQAGSHLQQGRSPPQAQNTLRSSSPPRAQSSAQVPITSRGQSPPRVQSPARVPITSRGQSPSRQGNTPQSMPVKGVITAHGPANLVGTTATGQDQYVPVNAGRLDSAIGLGNPSWLTGTIYGQGSPGAEFQHPRDHPLKLKVQGDMVSVMMSPPHGGRGYVQIQAPERTVEQYVPGGTHREVSGGSHFPGGTTAIASTSRSSYGDFPGRIIAAGVSFPIPINNAGYVNPVQPGIEGNPANPPAQNQSHPPTVTSDPQGAVSTRNGQFSGN